MDPATSNSTPGAGPSLVRPAGPPAGLLVAGLPLLAQASPSTSVVSSAVQPTASTSAAAAPAPRPPLPHAGSSGPGPPKISSGPPSNGLVANTAGPSTAPQRPPRPLPEAPDPQKQSGPIDEAKLISEGVRLRVFLTLAQDHLATIKPDVTAFRDHQDVLERLVPYHLWQIPEDDLHGPLGAPSRKGKGRARDWDEAEANAAERRALQEAIGFAKRKGKLDERFAQLRQREGLHASPSGMVIALGRELVNDELPAIVKTRSEAVQARHKQTILEAQIEQIRNPAPVLVPSQPPHPPRLPVPLASAPYGVRPGPASTGPPYQPQQGYPSTPIYRPAPGGGTYQPSRPLLTGTPTSTVQARPPGYRPPTTATLAGTSTPASRSSTSGPHAAAGAGLSAATHSVRPPTSALKPPAPAAGSGAPAADPPAKTINVHAPHSLSVPIAFLSNLQTAGILPNPTGRPPQPGLATDVLIDRDNVRFTVVLSALTTERIKTLSEVLSLAHGAEAKKRAAAAASTGTA